MKRRRVRRRRRNPGHPVVGAIVGAVFGAWAGHVAGKAVFGPPPADPAAAGTDPKLMQRFALTAATAAAGGVIGSREI